MHLEHALRHIFGMLSRIDQKLDMLGSDLSPAEKAVLITRLNTDAQALNASADILNEATEKLNTES